MMLEPWIIGAYAALLASVPAQLQPRIQPRDGGLQPHQTKVLPTVVGNKQYALICYYGTDGAIYGRLPMIYPPFASARVAYPGMEVSWETVSPERLGLTHILQTADGTPYLGTQENRSFTVTAWQQADRNYYLLISRVLERRWLLTAHPVTTEERATAKELQGYIRMLYDKPLMPYYQHEGRHFLAWLARAAQ